MAEYQHIRIGTGGIFPIAQAEQKKNGPVAWGTIDVHGVRLRLSIWPKQASRKNPNVVYSPISVEYAHDETNRLVQVSINGGSLGAGNSQNAGDVNGSVSGGAGEALPDGGLPF